MDNRTIYITDGQLLLGDPSAKPHGAEFQPSSWAWDDDDFDKILTTGITIDPEDRKYLRGLDEYWKQKGRAYTEKECYYYDTDDRLWDFRRRGMMMPPFTDRSIGMGGSYTIGDGWAMHIPVGLRLPDLFIHLYTGFEAYIDEAKKRKAALRLRAMEDLEKFEFYDATIISFETVIRMANRYADLAEQKAAEADSAERAAELREMARICRKVPAKGAETFWEGMQFLTFYWCLFCNGVTGLGRIDMMMWPLLKKDLEAGTITKEMAMEIIQCFRMKIADYVYIVGNPSQRDKWAGRARWNNIVLGGCDRSGKDASNPLTYMFLDAAIDLKLSHPGLILRVGEDTPVELLRKAGECVRTGVGYPSFISEKEYTSYMVEHSHGAVNQEEARDFACAGCIDMMLPGRNRLTGVPMIPVPFILELAMDGGKDLLMNTHFAIPCKNLAECTSYEEFYEDCFMPNLARTIDYANECCMARFGGQRQNGEDALHAGFFEDALDVCKDVNFRTFRYETANGLNAVGMVTTIDSLAAIKYICFDQKLVTPKELYEAMRSNWEGERGEEIRQMCLRAPKYGNADDYVDAIGEKLWNDFRDEARKYKGAFGNEVLLSAVSITTHEPAGRLTAATPDGRYANSLLSDAAASPSQGMDKNGPTAVIKSAMRMGQGWSTLLHNMKFSPGVLKTDSDLDKLGALVKTYLTHGGHQIQFNVVGKDELLAAQKEPENHGELIVRVAGYSTYFTLLNANMQTDIINRTAMECCE